MSWARGPLAEPLGLDECFELGDELDVAAEREVGLDALLDDDRAQLLEARDLRLCERLVEEVRERGPSPQCKGLTERDLGRLRLAPLERGAPFLRQARENDVRPLVPGRARARIPAHASR
jgi:hypothetical protein